MKGSKTKGKFTIKRYQIPIWIFNKDISKWHVKAIRTVLDEGRGLPPLETQVMVNSEEESN